MFRHLSILRQGQGVETAMAQVPAALPVKADPE
jgi:hypothetical protein